MTKMMYMMWGGYDSGYREPTKPPMWTDNDKHSGNGSKYRNKVKTVEKKADKKKRRKKGRK